MTRAYAAPFVTPAIQDNPFPVERASSVEEKLSITAKWILSDFDAYYSESRKIPDLAKQAFESRDHATTIALSKRRLIMYSDHINALGPQVRRAFPQLSTDESLPRQLETTYIPLIQGRYEADQALAFLHSVIRKVSQGEWRPVDYSFGEAAVPQNSVTSPVYQRFPITGPIDQDSFIKFLTIVDLKPPFKTLQEDAYLCAQRINQVLSRTEGLAASLKSVDMIKAGFFRNRGMYLVGRMNFRDQTLPLVIALLNDMQGMIYVDAVLHTEADAHNLFSSTLASFHVTSSRYHELADFMHSIMPHRPMGLHYSTLGFHHIGKVAVMNELKSEFERTGEVLDTAVGSQGTVAIGFAAANSAYNLKVIRDKPTDQYKWGEFLGIDAVLDKYRQVHEINRTGSMMDNVIFYNLRLHKSLFAPRLLQQLLMQAGRSVALKGSFVVFKHLIAQLKIIPIPVFLETASQEDAETAMVNMGFTIKNNAAANIFNKDLDARNYGVSFFLKVFLFDYDAIEPLTEVKARTNVDMIDGEEDVPDWFFEDGVVFLPEEIESGLLLSQRNLRRRFREVHGDLLTVEYWESIQDLLREGRVPPIQTYPLERRIRS